MVFWSTKLGVDNIFSWAVHLAKLWSLHQSKSFDKPFKYLAKYQWSIDHLFDLKYRHWILCKPLLIIPWLLFHLYTLDGSLPTLPVSLQYFHSYELLELLKCSTQKKFKSAQYSFHNNDFLKICFHFQKINTCSYSKIFKFFNKTFLECRATNHVVHIRALYWLTYWTGLHSGCSVHSVSKQTIPRHFQSNNSRYTRSYNTQQVKTLEAIFIKKLKQNKWFPVILNCINIML